MNAWLKRSVFNLDLNRESVSEPRTLSGRLFQSLGAKYEKVLPPLVDLWTFAVLGTTKSPEFCSLGSGLDCSVIEDELGTQELNHLGPYRQVIIFCN